MAKLPVVPKLTVQEVARWMASEGIHRMEVSPTMETRDDPGKWVSASRWLLHTDEIYRWDRETEAWVRGRNQDEWDVHAGRWVTGLVTGHG